MSDTHDRDQWNPQITHFSEHPMQRGLIDYRARQESLAVVLQGDRQASKPLRPLRTQMALDPDLIDRRLTRIMF